MTATKTVNIEGMHCHHCTMAMKKSFEMVEGIESAEVEVGRATLVVDEDRVTDREIEAAVTRAGYKLRDY